MSEEVRRILTLERVQRAAAVGERMPYGVQPNADDNTANPPTDAQLDTAFGTPATVGDGFVGVLDDAGAGTAVYLCVSDGTNWWHALLTKAV